MVSVRDQRPSVHISFVIAGIEPACVYVLLFGVPGMSMGTASQAEEVVVDGPKWRSFVD